jgi:hypothetical protein
MLEVAGSATLQLDEHLVERLVPACALEVFPPEAEGRGIIRVGL